MIGNKELYIVIDIETDGPVPGQYSMLSIGAIATNEAVEVGEFYAKLLPLDSASRQPSTMEWWATQPEAWEEVNKDQRPPELVIPEFRDWLKGFEASLVVTAHPIGFDYAFVSWYLWKFADENPFTNSNGALVSLDIASYIAGKYDLRLEDSKRHTMPDELKIGMPIHSHNALDDARGYGVILRNVLQA